MAIKTTKNALKLGSAFSLLSSCAILCASAATAEEIQKGDKIYFSHSQTTQGVGGGDWVIEDADKINLGEIDKIEVCSGNYVDSLSVFYNGNRGQLLGGSGGNCKFYDVPKTSFIREIIVWHGDWINGVQFIPDEGAPSDVFGSSVGNRVPISDPSGGALRQINGKFGIYLNQAEFKFGLPYYIDDLIIEVDKPIKEMRFSKPTQIDVNIGNNCANAAGELRFDTEFSKSATQTHSFVFSNTTGVELETKFKVGAPIIADGEVGISASTSFTFETTNGAEKTEAVKRSYTYAVPPNRRVDAAYIVKEATVDLPFRYNLYHYRNGNKSDHLPPKEYTGTYNGTLIASAETTLHEVDCRTGNRIQEYASTDDIPKTLESAGTSSFTWAAIPNGGGFKWAGDDTWYELSPTGDKAFTFEVLSQSDNEIRLRDVNRNILIVLDFARDKVRYASSPQGTPRDLYDIVNKS